MTFPGRWGLACAVVLTVSLLPLHAFAIDKLLIINGTDLTMKPGQTDPFVGYILVGNDGAVVLACNAMNLAKCVGGDLLVDTYHLQKNDMSKVSREVNQRVARLH
jgi:hypothetical protein